MRRVVVFAVVLVACQAFSDRVYGTNYSDVILYDHEAFTLTNGSTFMEIHAHDYSRVSIQGGSGGDSFVHHNSTMYVTGGDIGLVYADGQSRVYISGGQVQRLEQDDTAEIHLGGGSIYEESYWTVPLYVHILDPMLCHFDGSYLTGYWYGGDSMSIPMTQATYDMVTYLVEPIPVPEPATALLLATGAVLGARLKKKKTA
jgi:hypothetical protein